MTVNTTWYADYAAEKAARDAEAQSRANKEAERQAKLTGFEFEGVMCSVHKEDQWGLDSIKPLVDSGQTVPLHFKNGNVLLLTPDNLATFEQQWTVFRMSFFQPAEQ